MSIKSYNSPQSNTNQLEKAWFKKAELNEIEPNRFIHMPKGQRKNFWDLKIDLSKEEDLDDVVFYINQEKFVNRPEMISIEFYNKPQHWWIIALRNNIKNPLKEFTLGKKLLIPDFIKVRNKLGI